MFFDAAPLDFSVPGMSDVMPYQSSLFKELKGRRLTTYKKAFTHILETVISQFQPDIPGHIFKKLDLFIMKWWATRF